MPIHKLKFISLLMAMPEDGLNHDTKALLPDFLKQLRVFSAQLTHRQKVVGKGKRNAHTTAGILRHHIDISMGHCPPTRDCL